MHWWHLSTSALQHELDTITLSKFLKIDIENLDDVLVDVLDDFLDEEVDVAEEDTTEEVADDGSDFKGQPYAGNRNPDMDFVNSKGESTLIKHANKHGYESVDEYLNDARTFLEKNPTSTTQSFVSNSGTYFRYDTATNEFGIINDYGGISTYFKPEAKLRYWLEQIEKYAPQ